ncbi:MAG: type II secretion system F family protein [Phycisphaerales bacterium]|nr:type II secretion system F family protein [Phycisphaerales bacterium]
MGEFRYTAIDARGVRTSGRVAAATEQALLGELATRQLTPIKIEPASEGPRLKRGLPVRALGDAYLQLADLLRAGVPLLRSLRLLGNRKSKPRLSAEFAALADAVADGEELASAMEARGVFSSVHVAMIRAGEKGGFLEEVLERLGKFVVGQAELRGKILGNMIYPMALVVFGSAILAIIFGFFVPMFRPLFEGIEGGLPVVTQIVFAASSAVGAYGPITFGVGVVLATALWHFSKKPRVRRAITSVRTYAPVIGPLTREIAAARFCRMLGTLLANGVPMIQSMRTARDASGNVLLEEAIDKAADAVRAGEALALPLRESGLFTDDTIEIISVAEAANNLDTALIGLAENIEKRVDRLLTAAVRLIEPLMLMAIAAIVVVVAIGLVLPMTQLSAGV